MSAMRLIRVPLMLAGLVLVITFMRQLENKGLSPSLLDMLGVPAPVSAKSADTTQGGRHARLLGHLDWCETRVREIEQPGGMRLSQKGSKWMLQKAGVEKEVNFIAVEKWFARHCSINVEKVAAAPAPLKPSLIIRYVKGADAVIQEGPIGIFTWREMAFKSPELEAALAYLSELPPPTQPNAPPTNDGA